MCDEVWEGMSNQLRSAEFVSDQLTVFSFFGWREGNRQRRSATYLQLPTPNNHLLPLPRRGPNSLNDLLLPRRTYHLPRNELPGCCSHPFHIFLNHTRARHRPSPKHLHPPPSFHHRHHPHRRSRPPPDERRSILHSPSSTCLHVQARVRRGPFRRVRATFGSGPERGSDGFRECGGSEGGLEGV